MNSVSPTWSISAFTLLCRNWPYSTWIYLLVFEARGEFGVKSAGEVKGGGIWFFFRERNNPGILGILLSFILVGSPSIWQERILWGRLPLVLCWCQMYWNGFRPVSFLGVLVTILCLFFSADHCPSLSLPHNLGPLLRGYSHWTWEFII